MTLVTEPSPVGAPSPETLDRATVVERIAAVLGDRAGSYELLIGARICGALDIDPGFRGPLVAGTGEISSG
jgi:hypothetical protein